MAALAVGVLGSIALSVVFVVWVSINDAIYFPAAETGRNGTYPEGHFLYGWFAVGCITIFGALAIISAWYVFLNRRSPITSNAASALLFTGAILIGVSIPAIIQYATLGFVPLLAGLGCLLPLLLRPRASTPSHN
ncbi:hypothetical protein B7R22_14335 [Subtercola boreus]|uniref:Uncharacterized protein n=2 Tax=Subtercola boreus TaxID=120213 RepID=A0A3E0VUA6_9MICO|nr:hypothetical protein B7R22_14335 [Subtercola boreus]